MLSCHIERIHFPKESRSDSASILTCLSYDAYHEKEVFVFQTEMGCRKGWRGTPHLRLTGGTSRLHLNSKAAIYRECEWNVKVA